MGRVNLAKSLLCINTLTDSVKGFIMFSVVTVNNERPLFTINEDRITAQDDLLDIDELKYMHFVFVDWYFDKRLVQ